MTWGTKVDEVELWRCVFYGGDVGITVESLRSAFGKPDQ